MQVIINGQPANPVTLPVGTVVNVVGHLAGQVTISCLRIRTSVVVERAALDCLEWIPMVASLSARPPGASPSLPCSVVNGWRVLRVVRL